MDIAKEYLKTIFIAAISIPISVWLLLQLNLKGDYIIMISFAITIVIIEIRFYLKRKGNGNE
ncbi:MAG: hypothetical protein DRG78_04515 [Epsilonproteobacteria bacterium]|nr:MAG: hypothetical protein DRG78_04515 [Campylobacterota bacterium]